MSSLGLGYAKIVIEIERADGKMDRLTVHRLHLSDMEDSNLEMTPVDEQHRSIGTHLVKPSEVQQWEMSLDLEGKLFSVDQSGEQLIWEADVRKTEGAWACDNYERPETCRTADPGNFKPWCAHCRTNPHPIKEGI